MDTGCSRVERQGKHMDLRNCSVSIGYLLKIRLLMLITKILNPQVSNLYIYILQLSISLVVQLFKFHSTIPVSYLFNVRIFYLMNSSLDLHFSRSLLLLVSLILYFSSFLLSSFLLYSSSPITIYRLSSSTNSVSHADVVFSTTSSAPIDPFELFPSLLAVLTLVASPATLVQISMYSCSWLTPCSR